MLTISPDGYLRMTLAAFATISFEHLLSGLDDDHRDTGRSSTNVCSITGYTEWKSTNTPVASIGWDWQLDVSLAPPRYILAGPPRTNVMLVDELSRDLGIQQTVALIADALNTMSWQQETAKAISKRYAYTT